MSMYVFLTRRELKMAVLLAKFHFFFLGGEGGGFGGMGRGKVVVNKVNTQPF